MRGPFDLKPETVALAPQKPGVYMLGREGRKIWVSRADTNLRETLTGHLPEKEKSHLLKKYQPDCFWYEESDNAFEAYQLEFKWYVRFNPKANFLAPKPPEID